MKQKLKKLMSQKGQATLFIVLSLFGTASVLVMIVGGLGYNEIRKLNDIVKSSQSYYTSEAGVEDALLRLQNHLPYQATYNLAVGSDTTTVTVSGTTNDPIITSKGNVQDRIRKVQVSLHATSSGTHVAFNYGVQIGYGGLTMSNNAGVVGNVYSDGDISGSNGSYVTGTAIVANSPALSADQDNSLPASPPNSITFGNSSSAQDAVQSFQLSDSGPINKISLYIKKVSTPGNLTVRVTNNSSGKPGTTVFANGTLSASSVTGNYGWVDVTFSTNPQLASGVTYWLVLDGSSDSSKYYIWAANTAYSGGEVKIGIYSSGPWSATSLDGYFKVYLGGLTGEISNLQIGTGGSGDAHAHTITNSNITDTPYCQVGSGNNKPCNTSQPDPSPQAMPISDANIAQFKSEAEAGGVISGDYNLTNGASASLGPKKITGNMTLSNNVTLTITGTVWVQGHISLSNNVNIRLDPGYGQNGGVLIADGYIGISNNSTFNGSGQAGSYMLVITTNDCNGTNSPTGQTCSGSNSAMDVANNAGTVVLYASNGNVQVANNAGAKEITAYKLSLSNNSSVNYETGLASAAFSSGPGGGYAVKKWEEII